jgi:hypothetical protein
MLAAQQPAAGRPPPAAGWLAGCCGDWRLHTLLLLPARKKFTFHDSESQHSLFMTLRANIHFS